MLPEDPGDRGRARAEDRAATSSAPRRRAPTADETEAAWRARMDAARAEAARIAQDAKQESAAKTEAKVKAAGDKIDLKVEAARSQDPRGGRLPPASEIEAVAAEAAQEMVDAADRHQGRQEGRRRRR